MNKNNYIRQLKQLIKKYHPDLCTSKYLENTYNEITIKLNQKLNQIKEINYSKNIVNKTIIIDFLLSFTFFNIMFLIITIYYNELIYNVITK